MSRKWSAEIVVSAVQKRHQRKWRLNAYHAQMHCIPLYNAARRYFGTWNKALAAAGVPVPHRNKWSKRVIVEKIVELAASGEPLHNHHIKNTHKVLYTVSCQYFGGWGKAVNAAGFDYSTVRRKTMRSWSKKAVVKEIRRRQRAGLSISGAVVQRKDPGLYDAAILYFGSRAWQKARVAAGFSPKDLDPRFIYNKDEVLNRLRELHKNGVPLHYAAMRGMSYEHLISAAKRLFGSYPNALTAMGLKYRDVAKAARWTKREVITEIKKLEKEDVRLNGGAIFATHQSLAHAAMRQFGSWSQAVEAAGINYRKHLKIWSTKAWLRQMSDAEYRKKIS